MRRFFTRLYGNEKTKSRIGNAILSAKENHALLICGPDGSGKSTLALEICAALNCERKNDSTAALPCGVCNTCRRIYDGNYTDVKRLLRDSSKATIGVEELRLFREDMFLSATESDYKIYIIEEADIMTPQAQNALLLTLEEPPSYAVILLICENSDLLLETVRSRSPVLRMESVPFEIMSEYICNDAPEKYSSEARRLKSASNVEFDEIIACSNGSIGKALELLDAEKRGPVIELRKQVRELVQSVISFVSKTDVYDTISALSQKREDLCFQLELVTLAIRDLIVLKKSESAPLCFYTDRESALDLSAQRSASFLLKFKNSCEKAIDAIEKNANVKLTISSLAANISAK